MTIDVLSLKNHFRPQFYHIAQLAPTEFVRWTVIVYLPDVHDMLHCLSENVKWLTLGHGRAG